MAERTVRVYIDFPIALYRALVEVCQRKSVTIAVLVMRIAASALNPEKEKATPKADPGDQVRLLRQRASSAEAASRSAVGKLATARQDLRDARAAHAREMRELRAEVEATAAPALAQFRVDVAALTRENRRLQARLETARAEKRDAARLARAEHRRAEKLAERIPATPTRIARRTDPIPLDENLIRRLHEAGAAISQMADGTGISRPRIRQTLEDLGLPIPHKGPRSQAQLRQIAEILDPALAAADTPSAA